MTTDFGNSDDSFGGNISIPFNILDHIAAVPKLALHAFYQLKSTATYAFRVERDSDNATLDIGFANGYIDVLALAVFCGSANGFVIIWYDQGGFGNDLSEATNPPKIWDGATQNFAEFTNTVTYSNAIGRNYHAEATSQWNALSGPVPMVQFDNVAQVIGRNDALGFVGDPSFSVVLISRLGEVSAAPVGSALAIQFGDSLNGTNKVIFIQRDSTPAFIDIIAGNFGGYRQFSSAALYNTSRLVLGHTSGQNINAAVCRQNGVVLGQVVANSGVLNLENERLILGTFYDQLPFHYDGSGHAAVLVFDTDLTASANEADLGTIEAWSKAHRLPL
jgi:hypothetical protein